MLSISDEAGISYDGELITFITPLGYTKTAALKEKANIFVRSFEEHL